LSDPVVASLVHALVPLALKASAFKLIFHWWKHHVRGLTCIILAGALMIASIVPIPLPGVVGFVVGIGIALVILGYYTEVPLIPEGLTMIVAVEVGTQLLLMAVI
jgi:hypothetical protein